MKKCIILLQSVKVLIKMGYKMALHSIYSNSCFAFITGMLILRNYTLNKYNWESIDVPSICETSYC